MPKITCLRNAPNGHEYGDDDLTLEDLRSARFLLKDGAKFLTVGKNGEQITKESLGNFLKLHPQVPDQIKPEVETTEAPKPVANAPEAPKPVANAPEPKPVANAPEAPKPVANAPEAPKPVANAPEPPKPENDSHKYVISKNENQNLWAIAFKEVTGHEHTRKSHWSNDENKKIIELTQALKAKYRGTLHYGQIIEIPT